MSYIPHESVVQIRLLHEEGIGSGGDWGIDGSDGMGGYTEDCETYPTRNDALNAIPAFRKRIGAGDNISIVIRDGSIRANERQHLKDEIWRWIEPDGYSNMIEALMEELPLSNLREFVKARK